MWANLRFVEDTSPEARYEALYQDAKLKQWKLEEQQTDKTLLKLKELVDMEESQLPSQRRFDDFYQYNKRWQQNVQQKRQMLRNQYNEENVPKQFQREPDPHLYFEQCNPRPANYKGPIEGWKSKGQTHVHPDVQFPFKPQINSKSIEICAQNQGFSNERVEERLLKYGHDVENKKMYQRQQEQFNQQLEIERSYFRPNVTATNSFDERPVFERLYDYVAQYYEKKKQSYLDELESIEHPQALVSIPAEIEERVNEKRKNNPLYIPRQSDKSPSLIEQYEMQQKEKQKLTKQQFEEFLMRNFEARPQKIPIDAYNKEDEELRECSFQPYINPKSQELIKQGDVIARSHELLKNKAKDVQQLKEEMQSTEMEECSFKPNMNIDVIEEKKVKRQKQNQSQKIKSDKLSQDRAQRKVPQRTTSPISYHYKPPKAKPVPPPSPPKVKPSPPPITVSQKLPLQPESVFNLSHILKKPDPGNTSLSQEFVKVEQQIQDLFSQFN